MFLKFSRHLNNPLDELAGFKEENKVYDENQENDFVF